jgi:diguanylate cyclase (GGDEF)-like protein
VIDIPSFVLALGVGNMAFAVLMAGYTHGTAPAPGLRLWMWARFGIGICQLLGWFRPYLGVPVLNGLEGAGWVLAVSLEVAAYCIFFGLERWRRVLLPVSALALSIVLAAGSAGVPVAYLTLLVAGVVALFAAAMAWTLLRPRRNATLLQRIIGVNDAVFAALVALWAATHLSSEVPLGQHAVQESAYLAGYLLMIVNGFGFLLLCKEKDDADMARLATIDSLTGLLNRHAFLERAENARQAALRQRQPLALAMIDIDHFKQINDRFGHATGDAALTVFARTAREALREHETIGRLGGEEFAMVLPGTDLSGVLVTAERLRQAVRDAAVINSGSTATMTVSIGVVLLEPNETLGMALARADHALYAAKSGGRDRVEVGQVQRRQCA